MIIQCIVKKLYAINIKVKLTDVLLNDHLNIYKKRIDASVKERPQTLLVPSEEICKRVLCNKHI